MNGNTVFNILAQSGILALLLGLLASLLTLAKKMVDAKIGEITAKIKDANLRGAVETAENCVTTVVFELSQTLVDDLKTLSTDGKLTPADAAKIKASAVEKSRQLMSDEVYGSLQTVFGDADAWISSKIEAGVKQLKIRAAAPSDGGKTAGAIRN